MQKDKLDVEHIRAALRTEEKNLKGLLDAIELNDAPISMVSCQIRLIEEGLRRIRRAA